MTIDDAFNVDEGFDELENKDYPKLENKDYPKGMPPCLYMGIIQYQSKQEDNTYCLLNNTNCPYYITDKKGNDLCDAKLVYQNHPENNYNPSKKKGF